MGGCCGSSNQEQTRGIKADKIVRKNWVDLKRPFDNIATEEEKKKWSMDEYAEMQKVGEDGVNFAGKTSFMIAYERMLESERPEGQRLFNDYLAKHLHCGDVGKRVSEMLAYGLKQVFDPTDEIGLKYEGHVNYTAARTMVISDKVKSWIEQTKGQKQVLDMGAGMTTRVYWDEQLKDVNLYIEVDQKSVIDSKQKIFDELKKKGELKEPMCPRSTISMDYSVESTKDLPKHGFNQQVPTCWILEGLVMYLTKEVNEQMMAEMSALSVKGSYLILNLFMMHPGCKMEDMDAVLLANGWTKEETLMFGDADFNYGKYPEGKPANAFMGFFPKATLQKTLQLPEMKTELADLEFLFLKQESLQPFGSGKVVGHVADEEFHLREQRMQLASAFPNWRTKYTKYDNKT